MKRFYWIFFILFVVAVHDTRAEDATGSTPDSNLPPELRDIDLSSHKHGFMDLFYGYNPRNFSLYAANVGFKCSMFEYYSTNTLWGQPGAAEPAFYKTKQNVFFGLDSTVPLDFSTQALYSTSATPIYRFGVRWRVSSTAGLKEFFQKIHFSYAVNLQPIQFDSIPGYGWQIEHSYQLDFPYFRPLPGLFLRGMVTQVGNVDQNVDKSDSTLSFSSQLVAPVSQDFSVYADYKYSRTVPTSRYNGFSLGVEYRLPF